MKSLLFMVLMVMSNSFYCNYGTVNLQIIEDACNTDDDKSTEDVIEIVDDPLEDLPIDIPEDSVFKH